MIRSLPFIRGLPRIDQEPKNGSGGSLFKASFPEGQLTMRTFKAIIEQAGGELTREFSVSRMYNLGSATRNADVARPHQEEVAAAGVKIALHIPTPRIYPIDPCMLTSATEIGAHGARSSGEVEIVLVKSDRLYVGVGSDHTDRDLERASIVWSKAACANILAPRLWAWDEIADHWDRCRIRSHVDGRLYQDVGVDAFISPPDILRILEERVVLPQGDFVVFCGTIVALAKELGFGDHWSFEMEDPVRGRTIRHDYRIAQLMQEVREPWRVPVVTGSL
jgi:4-hydroxyphenylacetate 3-monooxygenase